MNHGMVRIASVSGMLACSAIAMAADASTAELKAQIDALQRKVDALEARQLKGSDVDATVQRVLADAEKRSQLMQAEGFTAGYNKGRFIIQSADGSFSFSPSAQLQVRYAGNYRDDDSEYSDGFELRRAKFGFNGNVFSPALTYKFVWATDRDSGRAPAGATAAQSTKFTDGGVNLEEGWVRYKLENNVFVFGGQFEDLTTHESLVSSSKQLAAEQSLVNRSLIDDFSEYTQGAGVGYEADIYRVSAAFTDGWNSDGTNYTNQTVMGTEVFWGASARGELMVIGDDWKKYDDFTALGNKSDSDLLVVGAGASFSEGADFRGILGGVDMQWEPGAVAGLSFYAGLLVNYIDNNAGFEDETNFGGVVQAGYLITPKFEVFGRYDQMHLDATEENFGEITAGVNYYVSGHSAKLTLDIGYLPDGAPATESGLAVQASDDAEIIGRAQFQLAL